MAEWISVSERLPYSGEDVLVCVLWRNRSETVDISWVDDEGDWAMGSAKGYRITHWQPLPPPPPNGGSNE